MRSSWNMWEPTWVSRSRCWLLTGECLGHVYMVPEHVGSTHLRFGDARVVMGNCMWLRRLFGVLDETPDVTRSSGGKDLYMGRPVSVTEMVSGVIGIVPGRPKGVP